MKPSFWYFLAPLFLRIYDVSSALHHWDWQAIFLIPGYGLFCAWYWLCLITSQCVKFCKCLKAVVPKPVPAWTGNQCFKLLFFNQLKVNFADFALRLNTFSSVLAAYLHSDIKTWRKTICRHIFLCWCFKMLSEYCCACKHPHWHLIVGGYLSSNTENSHLVHFCSLT